MRLVLADDMFEDINPSSVLNNSTFRQLSIDIQIVQPTQ